MNIYDLVTSQNLSTYWETKVLEETPYLGTAFFPVNKQLNMDLSWIKGADKSPVALQLSALDTKVNAISRKGFEKLAYEMPFFKNSLRIDEKTRRELNMAIASQNQAIIDVLLNKVFNDNVTLIRNAAVTREILNMQLLTTGAISLANNGQSINYNYGLPSANRKSATWSDAATADPISDISSWQDLIEQTTGERPMNLIMNSVTFGLIKKADAVKNAIYVLGQGKVTPSTAQVKQFILDETGCNVYVYSKGYTNDEGSFVKFVPDNVVALSPDILGTGWFASTPEESDLMMDSSANVSIVDTGVALTTTKLTDPVSVETKASMVYLPSGENVNKLIVASIS